jgi:hypothetical protein
MTRPVAGRATLGLTLALTLALAACGGGSATRSAPDDSSDPGPSDEPAATQSAEPTPGTALTACELLTPADIETALGLEPGTVAEGEHTETPTVLDAAENECRYQDEAWGGVIVRVTPTDGANLYDAARGAYADASDLVIVGSDGAFWSDDTKRGFVWVDPVSAMIQIGFVSVESPEWGDIAEQLLTSIVEKV